MRSLWRQEFFKKPCCVGLCVLIWINIVKDGSFASISIFQQPGLAIAAQPFQTQPLLMADSTETIWMTALSLPGGRRRAETATMDPEMLLGTTDIRSVNGWANFTDLMVARSGIYKIFFEDNTGEQITSDLFFVMDGLDHFTLISGQFRPVVPGPISPAVVIEVMDFNSNLLSLARFPVLVSIETIDQKEITDSLLSANITDQSCCMFADCLETSILFSSCCDCQNPICALCAIPHNGRVTFPGLSIREVGTYELVLTTNESSLAGLLANPITVFRTTENMIRIVSSRETAVHIEILTQPIGPFCISGPQLFAVLGPQSFIVQKYDPQGGMIGSIPGSGELAYAMPCFSAADVISPVPVPDGLCECSDLLCLALHNSSKFLGDAAHEFFSNGTVRFVNLGVKAAFNAMRLFVADTSNGTWIATTFSQPFAVLPGSLTSIATILGPTTIIGCTRCPRGVIMSGHAFNLTLELLDGNGNRIALCPAGTSPDCSGTPDSDVAARLFRGAEDVSALQGLPNLVGAAEQRSSYGVTHFQDLRVLVALESYFFRFFALDSSGRSVSSSSALFQVVSGPPAQVVLVALDPSIPTDTEPFAVTAQVADAQGNLVNNDCYTDCGGSLGGLCSANTTACGVEAVVSIQRLGQLSRLLGTLQTSSEQGRVLFDAVIVDANWASGGDCNCSATTQICAACSSPQCTMPPPWPTFQITVSLPAFAGSEVTTSVTFARRVQSLVLLNQPQDTPAQEPLQQPINVQALQCDGIIAAFSRAEVRVEMGSHMEDSLGQLSGTLVVSLLQGMALFTDLQIDRIGTYALRFTLLSSALQNPSVLSLSFVITKPVSQLLILSTPGSSTAGVPFSIQPRIVLLDDAGDTVDSTLAVTATLQDNPGNFQVQDPGQSALVGNLFLSAQYGSVAFTDLELDKASLGQDLSGVGYTIRFSSGNLGVTSSQFTVRPVQWAGLYLPPFAQPVGSFAGSVLQRQPTVFLVDRFLNRILASDIPYSTTMRVAVLTEYPETNVTLQCNGQKEICSTGPWVGMYPLRCATCPMPVFSVDNSFLAFTDLRVDIATGSMPGQSPSFRLNFSSMGFVVVSSEFEVQSAAAAYLTIEQDVLAVNSADEHLRIQPVLFFRDRFGNVAISSSHLEVSAKLLLPPGANFTAGKGGLCRLAKQVLQGNLTKVPTNGVAQFTDIAVRQAAHGYALLFTVNTSQAILKTQSATFAVVAGGAVDICVMSALDGCSDMSPCIDQAMVVCIDAYGNVQPTCASPCITASCCGRSPFNIPADMRGPCYAGVCAQLGNRSGGRLMTWTANVSIDCSKSPCSAPLLGGAAEFSSLALTPPGDGYSVHYFTFVECMGELLTWSAMQTLNVYSAPPYIIFANFSDTLAFVEVFFDKSTNMRLSQPSSCDIFDPVFVAKLGVEPVCLWADSITLVILLGGASSVDNATQILLGPDCGITNQFAAPGEMQSTTDVGAVVAGKVLSPVHISYPQVLPSPVPIIVIPHMLGACSRLQGDSSLSQGTAARPMASYNWGIDISQSYKTVGILEAAAPNDPDLQLSPAFYIKNFIHFSSFAPRVLNTVTVTLRPSAPVTSSAVLIISGLTGYSPTKLSCPLRSAPDPPTGNCFLDGGLCRVLFLRGPSAFRFAATNFSASSNNLSSTEIRQPSAQWTGDGLLVIKVDPSHSIPTTEDTVFSFQITNPSSMIVQSVSISFSFEGSLICPVVDCISTASVAHITSQWFSPQAMQTDCNSSDSDSEIPGSIVQSVTCTSKLATFYVTSEAVPVAFGYINETSQVTNQVNNLTLVFQPSSELSPGLNINLTGLTGLTYPANYLCLHGSDAALFECNTCVTASASSGSPWKSFGPAGYWDPLKAQLSLILAYSGQPVAARNIVVSFNLVNSAWSNRINCGDSATLCPSKAAPLLSMGAGMPPFILQGDVLGSGESPGFLTATAQESNPFQNLTNVITVEFTANIVLNGQCSLTLSGLPDFPSSVYSNIADAQNRSCFQPMKDQLDAIVLAISTYHECTVPAEAQVILWLAARNTHLQWSPPPFYVSATCPSAKFQKYLNSSTQLFRFHDSVKFYDGFVTLDNSIPGQSCGVNVTVRCSVSMLEGSILTVSGLSWSSTLARNDSDSLLSITAVTGQGLAWETTAKFNSFNGRLVVSLGVRIPAGTTLSLLFRLIIGTSPPSLGLSTISGFVLAGPCQDPLKACYPLSNISNEFVTVAAQDLNEILTSQNTIPQIVMAKIEESNRVMGAFNMLTVRMRCNFDIIAPASITIAGLDGSLTVQVSRLIPVMEWIDLLPNCSCPYKEAPYPCLECTDDDAMLIAQSFRIWQPDGHFGEAQRSSNGQPTGYAEGSWNPLCPVNVDGASCLILKLSAGQQHPANTDLYFAFMLQNSMETSKGVTPTIYVNTAGISEKRVMSGTVLGGGSVPSFTLLAIEENSDLLGGFSNVTISLLVNCPLFSTGYTEASVTISGLAYFQTPIGYLPLHGDGSRFVSRDGWGWWQQDQGSLIMSGSVLPGDCSSSLDYSIVPMCSQGATQFTVMLKNKALTIDGLAFPAAVASSAATQVPATLFGGLALNRASITPSFSFASVRESSAVLGQNNTITFSFACNTNLTSFSAAHRESASSITITGLKGTQSPDAIGFPISGPNASLFDSALTTWSQAGGVLILYLADNQNVAADDPISFSIVIINPFSPQQTNISISGQTNPIPDDTSPPIPVPIVVNYGQPLILLPAIFQGDALSADIPPTVVTSSISESSRVNGAISTISIAFTLNADVQAGGTLLLSGLQYTTASSAQIVVGGLDGDSVSSARWNVLTGTLLLSLALPIYADEPFAVSFKLQNRQCTSPAMKMTVFALIADAFLPSMGPDALGELVGCGEELLWRTRTANESSGVAYALNTLTFLIQPSAPLYSGTVVTIAGLRGTQTKTCVSCLAVSDSVVWTLGMGCSLLCEEDACQPAALLPGTSCIPVFSGSPPNPSEVFGPLGIWNQHDNSVVVTVAESQSLSDTAPTAFSVMLWNPPAAQARVDCGASASAGCLTVTAGPVSVCDPSKVRMDTESCRNSVFAAVRGIGSFSPPLSLLYDSCPHCLRSPDILAAHVALQAVTGPSFTDLVADPPSLDYLPTLIQGGLVSGTYVLLLTLTNWLGMSATASSSFTSDGPLPLTMVKPFVYIEGVALLQVHSGNAVSLSARGSAAACIEGYETETVSYRWSLVCIGSLVSRSSSDPICALTPSLSTITVTAFSSTLSILPSSLTAGAVFQVTCSVMQLDLVYAASSYVTVQVTVDPLVAIISGVVNQV